MQRHRLMRLTQWKQRELAPRSREVRLRSGGWRQAIRLRGAMKAARRPLPQPFRSPQLLLLAREWA